MEWKSEGFDVLNGEMKPISEYSKDEFFKMYFLMETFYDNIDKNVFEKDFFDKDYCLTLYNEEAELVGFTTQKLLDVNVNGKIIHGIFSGDTIIHKDYWGSTELFRVYAQYWFKYAEQYEEFYWFLICKGYKTYRIMSLFWTEFYPNYQTETPAYEKKIIDAYAKKLYPDEYNQKTGVIEYKTTKDKLKKGVADIEEHLLKNKDIAYFCERNPGHYKGNDLVCLAKFDKSLLKKRLARLLFE